MLFQHPPCLPRFLIPLLRQWHIRPSYVFVVSVPRGLAVTQQDQAIGPGSLIKEKREGGREGGREDGEVRRGLIGNDSF
jgi:hypothetical protein